MAAALPAESDQLCKFCNAIDFSATGLYPANQAFALMFSKSRDLSEVLENPSGCYFCNKISANFERWHRGEIGGSTVLDLEDASVFVGSSHLRSFEADSEGSPKGILLRVHIMFSLRKPFPDAGWFGPIFQYQRTTSNVLNGSLPGAESQLSVSDEVESKYYGRVRPLLAACRLFRKWDDICRSAHGEVCSNYYTGDRLPWIRLIDVDARCIVDNPGHDLGYVALSYVWGKANLPRLTTATDQFYRQAGSLAARDLPKTISDAIEVAKSLGMKYIWIDCLCVMQDDDADKGEFIPKMDSVFGFASLTIIAASGANAATGLPGIRPGSRHEVQDQFVIKGIPLVSSLDPPWEGASLLDNSIWNQRGWCFQEGLFAGKTLIFTSEQVYWGCQRASWCEDTHLEQPLSIFRHSFLTREVRNIWQPDVDNFQHDYRNLVEQFSSRTLSFEGDGLDAFAGVLHAFERNTGQSFFWGLPCSFFSNSLRWLLDKMHNTRRRTASCTMRSQGSATVQCPFPSWSWVGWVGKAPLMDGRDLTDDTTGLVSYRLDQDNKPRIIQEAPSPNVSPEVEGRRSPMSWKDDSRTVIHPDHIPKQGFHPSIAPTLLCFWSSTATLRLRHLIPVQPTKRSHSQLLEPIISHAGKEISSQWFHLPEDRPGEEEEAEFVIIARNALPGYPDRLATLMINWENDLAYRRGLVGINASDWNALDNRVWKPIVMA